jgi:5-methylcytosine-specific restriction endonuclease McrA
MIQYGSDHVEPMRASGTNGLRSSVTTAEGGATTKPRRICKIKASELLTLIDEQGYRCALTGRELTPDTSAVDHINPVSKGGDHAISNMQVLHRQVNQAKGTMTQSEFIAMCR